MPKKRSSFQKTFELAAVRVVFWTLSIFPLGFSMWLSSGFARLAARLFPRLNKTALRNLQIAYPEMPESERRKLAAGTFESLGRHLGFISHFRHFEREDIRRSVEVVGKEHFYKARESGRGLIFFTGHFGSWEVFNLLPPAFDEHINILVRRIDNALVENYIDEMRTKFGSVTLGKKEAPRQMYRLLEKGEIVGILADLNSQLHDGVFVDFFGVPACTTTSIAKLALRTNSVIMPAFAVWKKEEKKYYVYLEPPIDYSVTDDPVDDVLQITTEFTKIVEKYVRKYPEQWLWIHKRWNTRPKGEKSLY